MSLYTSNRDGGKTDEAGLHRLLSKIVSDDVVAGLAVSQRGAGANMSVDVAVGDAVIHRSSGDYGHPVWSDATTNVVIDTADVSNPRYDIIVMYVDYGETPSTGVSNNSNGVVKIASVEGTPAGSPSEPDDSAIQSSVGSGNPWIKLARITVGSGVSTITNSVIKDLRSTASMTLNPENTGGWIDVPATELPWSYSSWTSGTFTGVITVPSDATTRFTPGMRVKITQSTGGTKYGLISKVESTSLTVFFGTSYTLNNETISSPSASALKAPFGFPLNPVIWTLSATDTSTRTQSSPNGSLWYNLGSLSLLIPIGIWEVTKVVDASAERTSAVAVGRWSTLSTANNSETDKDFSSYMENRGASGTVRAEGVDFVIKKLSLTSATTYYLNSQSTGSATSLDNFNTKVPALIKAVSAYL